MSDLELFTKEEALEFVDSFEECTKTLELPMIGWFGDGAHEIKDARLKIENGFIPETINVISKRPNEEYWDSVCIEKDYQGHYEISTDDMSTLSGRYALDIETALREAYELLIEYYSLT